MSLFEDPLEVHYNAKNTIQGVAHIKTLKQALDRVASPPEDVTIILDWDSLDAIAHPLDEEPDVDGLVPKEHVELRPDKIELALDTQALVFGVEAGQDIGLVMDPYYVRYTNEIMRHQNAVAIEFE